MKKMKSRSGFTLAEMLLVVAIIVILSGVAFISVNRYQRSLGLYERDEIAKEIFIAAQNHLTVAYGQGYLGITQFGNVDASDNDIYYLIVNGGAADSNSTAVFDQMLPFGAIDETVRAGGSIIIRYQKSTGLVLDVFYCSRSGGPATFNIDSFSAEDYAKVLAVGNKESKAARKSGAWRGSGSGIILGWYGGQDAINLTTLDELLAPTITVSNEEKLTVTVTDNNGGSVAGQYSIQLIITGKSSNAKKAYVLQTSDGSKETVLSGARMSGFISPYEVILDDITNSGTHFGSITADVGTFIPGENIEIQAVAYSISALANIAYSNTVVTNSLFESIKDSNDDNVLDTAYIANIRHLENLDACVSDLGSRPSGDVFESFSISTAKQSQDIKWKTFKEKTDGDSTTIVYSTNKSPYYFPANYTTAGSFYPISPDYQLTYDGQYHSIEEINVDIYGEAGLFGDIKAVTMIKDLELLEFTINGTSFAGALAGSVSNCNIINVLARNKTNAATVNVSASYAGGLIGSMDSCSLKYSAASLIVNGTNVAGGLVGNANIKNDNRITGCYSAGHTEDAAYDTNSYNVTGGTAGGLIGSFSGNSASNKIDFCYSTCSVSGALAGGFVGYANGGSIENCYSTGLVDANSTVRYAFLGRGSTNLSNNRYYMIVNIITTLDENGKEITEIMDPMREYDITANLNKVQPLDLNTDIYNAFTGSFNDWKEAKPYDTKLIKYYGGKYTLQTVSELGASIPSGYADWNKIFVSMHYGDWPSPEVFFINDN